MVHAAERAALEIQMIRSYGVLMTCLGLLLAGCPADNGDDATTPMRPDGVLDAGSEDASRCEPSQEFDEMDGGCVQPALGQRPNDACGPAGEGDIPFADCDESKGLYCEQPPPGLLDAPSSCQCPEGQRFSAVEHACTGSRLGEPSADACERSMQCEATQECDAAAGRCVDAKVGQRPDDACGPAGEGDIPFADCDESKGLRCVQSPPEVVDAPPSCQCADDRRYSTEQHACVESK
jgi:hypothetical protein